MSRIDHTVAFLLYRWRRSDSSYALGLPQAPHKEVPDEPPPFLGTWRRVYIFVLGYLALVIAALYIFSRIYAP